MQEVTITRAAITSEAFTLDMLREIAIKMLGKTADWVDTMAAGKLSKPSKAYANLSYNKLRTTLDKLLTDSPAEEYGELYANGELTWEFECLPDLDISNAGKNTKRERKAKAEGESKPRANKLVGAYEVAKRPNSPTVTGKDAGKWEIWEHVWSCTSFEEFFAKAPKKAVTATGRVITPSSEMGWAVKCGWIKPVAAE